MFLIAVPTSDSNGHFTGLVEDFESISAAFQGVYGAWVNTDGFTIGEQKEIHVGMRIFEIAKQTPSMRHYVWSNLDYALKVSTYVPGNLLSVEFTLYSERRLQRGLPLRTLWSVISLRIINTGTVYLPTITRQMVKPVLRNGYRHSRRKLATMLCLGV